MKRDLYGAYLRARVHMAIADPASGWTMCGNYAVLLPSTRQANDVTCTFCLRRMREAVEKALEE